MIYKFRDTTAIDTSLQTKEGSLVTIENPDEVIDIKSLTVDLEPIQDLNGYSKPWVGGAGKNKLHSTATSVTRDGITFTVNSDGTVNVNGTATANTELVLTTNAISENGYYLINGCPSGSSNSTYWLNFKITANGASYWAQDYGSGYSLSNGTIQNFGIFVKSGATVNNAVFKPMIRLASETDATYEPYENICPISGHDSVDVTRTGKNLLDYDAMSSGYINGYGEVSPASTTQLEKVSGFIPITAGQAYTFSTIINTAYGKWVGIGVYDAEKKFIRRLASGDMGSITDITYALPSSYTAGASYVRVSFRTYGIATNVQFEEGTEKTEHDGYAQTYTTDLGRTVYGGTLDVTSGVLTVDRAMVDITSNTFALYTNQNKRRFETTISGVVNSGYASINDAISSHFVNAKALNANVWGTFSLSAGASGTGYLTFYDENSEVATLADFQNFIQAQSSSGKPVQIYYPLATPQTYQLTAQQIELLLGDNNIWSSGGNVTVTYAIDPALYQGMPTEAVSINGRFLEKLIDGYRTLYTKGRESLEVELGTYSTGTADGEKIKNHRYPARVLTVGFQLLSSTPEEFRERFNQLNNILSLEEADFIFADETDKFFTGTPIMDASVEAGQMNVTGEWKIYCGYPFKRSVQPITLTSTTDATISGNTATFNFNYKGVMPSKPLLRCEFASAKSGGDYTEDGDCGFVAFLNADESIIQLGNPEVIDVDATNKNEALINSEFDAFTGWTNSGKTIRSISDPYWNNGAGQTQNYASGVGTLTRNIASTIGFELDMVHRLSVSSPTQTGTFKTLLKNGNTTVVGFSIEKTGSGTAGTVKYIINDKVVGTDAIDLSQYNEHFGYCNRTPVYVAQTYYTQVVTYVKKKKKKKKKKVVSWVANTRWVQSGWNYTQSNLNSGISRDGAVVTFSVGELPDRTFKDSDIATKPCTSISIESTGTFDTNAVRSVALIQKAGVPFAEIPNVFTAGDIVEADCNSANVFLYRKGSMTGHLEPQYGALGNDWEDFEIKVGQNAIRAVWSDWVNTNYKPVIKIIFNEVYI